DLAFDTTYVDHVIMRDLIVRNTGLALLSIDTMTIEGTGYSLPAAFLPAYVPAGHSTSIPVRFTPLAPCSPCPGNIILHADDPDHPISRVALSATALRPPRLDLDRDTLRVALAPTLALAAILDPLP